MTTNDNWLRAKAQQRKEQAAQASQREESKQTSEDRHRRLFTEQIDELWGELEREVRRQIGVYNEATGDPNALYVETQPDLIDIRSSDGEQIALRLNRKQQSLGETHHHSTGVYSSGASVFSFTVDDDRLAFLGGVPAQMAAGLLRKLLD